MCSAQSMQEETKKKISKALKGHEPWNKGKTASEETKKKLSEAHKGLIPWNKGKKTGVTPWNKGKFGYSTKWKGRHHSEETKKKMREASKAKPVSEETRKKMSEARKGKPLSEETKRKISKSNKGKHHTGEPLSEETKKKISETLKGNIPWNKGIKTGKPSWNKGKHHSSETRKRLSESHIGLTAWNKGKLCPQFAENSRRYILKAYESGKFPKQTNTLPEHMIKQEFIERGFKEGKDFIQQYKFNDRFVLDFYFLKEKLIVECDGDYWHVNPIKYAGKKLTYQQERNLKNDKAKDAYFKKIEDAGACKFIRFWEFDIKKDVKACVDEILKKLKETGYKVKT